MQGLVIGAMHAPFRRSLPVICALAILVTSLILHGGFHAPPPRLCSDVLFPPYVRPPTGLFPLSLAAPAMPPHCAASLRALISAAPAREWPPPCPAPLPLRAAYQAHGLSFGKDWCFAQRYEGESEYVLDWNEAYITQYCQGIDSGRESGSYGAHVIARVQHAFTVMAQRHGAPPSLAGTVGMVMGSERPWVECLALNLGAEETLTFEYGTIRSAHPRAKARPLKEIAADFIAARAHPVDWVASFSSLEHSGLGRYGDALNPEGDAEALRHAWCMLKPGGVMLLGVPAVCRKEGFIEYNAHRVYGFERLAFVARGFELLGFTDACGLGNEATSVDHAGRIVLLRKPLSGLEAPELRTEDFATASDFPFRAQCKH
jgi:hypothetical protein